MKNKLRKVYYKLLKVKSRIFYGRPVLVIMYHRVSNVIGDKMNHLTVSIENFEHQLRYFKEQYQVLNLDEEWKSLKKTGLVITFDDGYADNLINALPLLEKYNVPATIFITTLNINTNNEFWWDRFAFYYSYCAESFSIPDSIEKISKSNSSYKNITTYLNRLSNGDKEEWFMAFEKINQIQFSPREEYRSLTNSELELLSQHPLITIGNHTHNHYPLGNLTYEEQKQELLLSKIKLNELTSSCINYLALPHGSYNSDTFKIIDELNLKGVLLANDYYSSIRNKASKKIYRILMPNLKGQEMKNRLKRFHL